MRSVMMSNPCLEAAPKPGDWIKTHEDYVEKAQKSGDCDVIFIGDSIIKYLEKSCLWHDFRVSCKCVNFGIPGDRVENVLWRVQNGELMFSNQIKAVVLLVGTNNIDCRAEDIFEGIVGIIKEIRLNLGDVFIILPSLLPKGQYPNPYRAKNAMVNKLLREIEDDKIIFVEIGKYLIQEDETIPDTLLYDYLHLTDIGYIKTFTHILEKIQELHIAK